MEVSKVRDCMEGKKSSGNWKEITETLATWTGLSLKSFYPVGRALLLAKLAAVCTSEKSLGRPSMIEIVFSLSFLTQSTSEMDERSWVEPDQSL